MALEEPAADVPSADTDRCTDDVPFGCLIDAPTTAAAGVVPHRLIDIPTSTGGDGRGGSCVAADIKESTVQGTLCQLLHCVRPPLQIIF